MSSDGALALSVQGLGKRYRLGETVGGFRDRALSEEMLSRLRRGLRRNRSVAPADLWALRDVSFDVRVGERVGIIGRNGAGKSTLLKILSQVTTPSEGRVETWGRIGALLEVGTGFHPELTGRENIFLSGAILGMSRAEVARKLDDIVEFSGVEKFIDTPIKRYSSGMGVRLAFAVAAHIEPEILLVDEVLAVGDAEFQRKCLARIAEIGSHGRTVVFVSHNMPAIMRLCERVIVLEGGAVAWDGSPQDAVHRYLDAAIRSVAQCEWESPSRAPGDSRVRLKAVRVLDPVDMLTDRIEINEPFTIEVEYWQLSDAADVHPVVVLQISDQDGTLLFQTADQTNVEWFRTRRGVGVVTSRCRVPGNLLAEGQFLVSVTVSTSDPYVRHVVESDVVAVDVVEASDGVTVKGGAIGEWPGLVRPWLDWSVAFERAAPDNAQHP
ncbi:MAG TPA: ABC transporter ATP-binding protein [Acidimicrobiales bacterium]|nr:ABC transporter ATP-binding protein [Acidimicrobiales bacterium]